jgi:hypothetical protein
VTDRIDHGEQRQTESQRHACESDFVACQNRGAAAAEDEYERPDELSKVSRHVVILQDPEKLILVTRGLAQ